MIEIAALVQKWEDLVIILVMLLVNAGLDLMQEYHALNALKTLKAKMDQQVTVFRDSAFSRISSKELVPGQDVNLLDKLPVTAYDLPPFDFLSVSTPYFIEQYRQQATKQLTATSKLLEYPVYN